MQGGRALANALVEAVLRSDDADADEAAPAVSSHSAMLALLVRSLPQPI